MVQYYFKKIHKHVREGGIIDRDLLQKDQLFCPEELFQALKGTPFTRRLPPNRAIQGPLTNQILKLLVANGCILVTEVRTELWPHLNKCFTEGWVHAGEAGKQHTILFHKRNPQMALLVSTCAVSQAYQGKLYISVRTCSGSDLET